MPLFKDQEFLSLPVFELKWKLKLVAHDGISRSSTFFYFFHLNIILSLKIIIIIIRYLSQTQDKNPLLNVNIIFKFDHSRTLMV